MFFPRKTQLRSWWNSKLFTALRPENLAEQSPWSARQLTAAWLILVVCSLVVLLPNLCYPLIEPDETRYAQIAIEMIESRDWVTPTLDGQPYLDKPPLMYWLTAVSFQVFGANEVAARIPPVLSSLGMIFLTFFLGQKIVGQRAAWYGALALLLSGGFILAGRFLILDSLLAFFTTLCLYSGHIALRHPKHRWTWWALSGMACALGVLTKGPIALVLCAPPLIASGWLCHDQSRTRILHWAAFVLPVILTCVPWYLAVWKFNPEFGDYFFWEHNFKRFVEGSNHPQPFWFYIPIVLGVMFPVSLLIPSLGFFLFSRAERQRGSRSKDLGFLFCASAWILTFFSLSSCKLPTYILPAIPLISLMIGVMMEKTVFEPRQANGIKAFLKPFPQRASLICLFAVVVIASIDVWLTGNFAYATVLAIGGCLVAAAITARLWNSQPAFSGTGWGLVSIVGVAMIGFTTYQFVPTIATTRSLYVKTIALAEQNPDRLIVFFGEKPHGVQLQISLERVVSFPISSQDDFTGFMSNMQNVILVTSDESIDSTRSAIAATHDLVPSGIHEHLYIANRIEPTSQNVANRNSRVRH